MTMKLFFGAIAKFLCGVVLVGALLFLLDPLPVVNHSLD